LTSQLTGGRERDGLRGGKRKFCSFKLFTRNGRKELGKLKFWSWKKKEEVALKGGEGSWKKKGGIRVVLKKKKGRRLKNDLRQLLIGAGRKKRKEGNDLEE